MSEIKNMRIGPMVRDWPSSMPITGVCKDCGGECDGDDCGTHKAGCVFGGPTEETSYWLIADGCELYHGEVLIQKRRRDHCHECGAELKSIRERERYACNRCKPPAV